MMTGPNTVDAYKRDRHTIYDMDYEKGWCMPVLACADLSSACIGLLVGMVLRPKQRGDKSIRTVSKTGKIYPFLFFAHRDNNTLCTDSSALAETGDPNHCIIRTCPGPQLLNIPYRTRNELTGDEWGSRSTQVLTREEKLLEAVDDQQIA